jgi:hypothetical protein
MPFHSSDFRISLGFFKRREMCPPPILRKIAMKELEEKIGLTTEQARHLIELSQRYEKRLSSDASSPKFQFGNYLASYLSRLAIDAEIENKDYKLKKSDSIRRSLIKDCSRYLGYAPTPDDLLRYISQLLGEIDDTTTDAIRRDLIGLTK